MFDEQHHNWHRRAADLGKDLGRKAFEHGKERASDFGRAAAVGGGTAAVESAANAWRELLGRRHLVLATVVLGLELVGSCQSCSSGVGAVKAAFQTSALKARKTRFTGSHLKPVLADLHGLAEEVVDLVLNDPWPTGSPIPERTNFAIREFRTRLNDLNAEPGRDA